MAVMAEWHGRSWEVSPWRLAALAGLSTSLKLKKDTNEDKDGGNPTNVKGYEAQGLSFDYEASTAAGGDPRAEFEAWQRLVGQTAPFYLGGRRFGPSRIQLVEVSLGDVTFSNQGRMLLAKISLKFEQNGPLSLQSTREPAGIGTSRSVVSAARVGPSAAEKAARK
ncbi:hypothetical protein [Anaerotruncus colihominis]|uniref:Phage P2 GpU n=1 Tax=Anaerotruncus colihominis DSM 17241 TaxID=445972 RepID=B0PEZ5_9FIRM|nr:hypothetical protein [Anaerotruncus colihominis]EDS09928.1 hypothetical protein ANACOL_03373 [Anaerotruncus colihominis DSM 17241]UWN73977.1 hypothetical protein NQ528_12245 [Anaerotruncus colihominis]